MGYDVSQVSIFFESRLDGMLKAWSYEYAILTLTQKSEHPPFLLVKVLGVNHLANYLQDLCHSFRFDLIAGVLGVSLIKFMHGS